MGKIEVLDHFRPDPHVESESKRDAIIEQATRLFCEKGYESTSVREIVQSVGVTKPVLYYYFSNKEALFRATLQAIMDPFLQSVMEACNPITPKSLWDSLKDVAEIYLHSAKEAPDRVRFVHAIAFSGLYTEIIDFQQYWLKALGAVAGLFRNVEKSSILRQGVEPDSAAGYFLGMCESAMRSLAYCPEAFDREPNSHEIISILKKGVSA